MDEQPMEKPEGRSGSSTRSESSIRAAADVLSYVETYLVYRDGGLYYRTTGERRGGTHGHHYRRISILNRRYYEHRIIFLLFHKRFPSTVDHINQDKHDNRIENLREVSPAENNLNKPIQSRNTSGYKGVLRTESGKRWKAQISIAGRVNYLGSFDTKQEAVAAYERAIR